MRSETNHNAMWTELSANKLKLTRGYYNVRGKHVRRSGRKIMLPSTKMKPRNANRDNRSRKFKCNTIAAHIIDGSQAFIVMNIYIIVFNEEIRFEE